MTHHRLSECAVTPPHLTTTRQSKGMKLVAPALKALCERPGGRAVTYIFSIPGMAPSQVETSKVTKIYRYDGTGREALGAASGDRRGAGTPAAPVAMPGPVPASSTTPETQRESFGFGECGGGDD